jgi:hypothetical protein
MSVVLTLWLAVATPSDIAHMHDMAVERELYMDTDSEEQISLMMTVAIYHLTNSPSLDLKTV